MYDSPVTIKEALETAEIERADAEVILADLLGKHRAWLWAHSENNLADDLLPVLAGRFRRRKLHEPVAYITGKKEFYGREFLVSPAVLIPRPSTECLIEATLDFLETGVEQVRPADNEIVVASLRFGDLQGVQTIVDVGTGSGCIAITLKLELPQCTCLASDLSQDALAIASINAKRLGAIITFSHGNLLDPFLGISEPFILVSNPPYVPSGRKISQDVSEYEPQSALYAGASGTDVLVPLLKQARNHPNCTGIVIECMQTELLEGM